MRTSWEKVNGFSMGQVVVCRNYRLHTVSVMRTVCRFAVRMPREGHPYRF